MGRHRDAAGSNDDTFRDLPLAVGHDRRRRGRAGAFVALAGAFAIMLGLGITGWYVIGDQARCGDEVTLEVAVAPELVPAVAALAEGFNDERHETDSGCVTAQVRAEEPDNVTYGITSTGPTTGDTDSDVWIPDSSLWAGIVTREAGEDAIIDTGTPIAHSPLILAQPADASDEGESEPIENLVPTTAPAADEERRDVRVIDPLSSASGLATLSLVSGAIDDDEEGQPELIAALQALQRGAMPNEENAFDTLSSGDDPPPLMAISEQAVWRYNTEHEDAPAHVSYPEGGSYTLDYPYLVRSEDPEIAQAAEQFRSWLVKEDSRAVIRQNGFRSPDGTSDADVLTSEAGFQENPPDNLPTPSDDSVASLTQSWNQMSLDTRLLTIIDVSGSMMSPVPGTDMDRMDVTTEASIDGLTLFPDSAELGQWIFSTDLDGDADHEETAPMRELGDTNDGMTHRDRITEQLENTTPRSDGDTALYNTYLAAYREMLASYRSDRINAILMLTDGEDDVEDGISLDELLSTIEEESSEDKPIPIISIAFGPSIDPEPLDRIAEATGGAAYTTDDPTEIGEIHLKAFSLRLREPGDVGAEDD